MKYLEMMDIDGHYTCKQTTVDITEFSPLKKYCRPNDKQIIWVRIFNTESDKREADSKSIFDLKAIHKKQERKVSYLGDVIVEESFFIPTGHGHNLIENVK